MASHNPSLAFLLADPPPADDFAALDALYACWPRDTIGSDSGELLAVASNLSQMFGLPGKTPMAASKAWRMLSPDVFQAEMAGQLAAIEDFIAQWQGSQRTFLILEFGEIELIESLFEALDPAQYTDLLIGVMNFKVLSNRRLGLLRRIPNRMRRQAGALLPARRGAAIRMLESNLAFLHRAADPGGFAPIVEAASKALEEVERMHKALTAPPPPAAGGGMPLGRIG